MERRRTVGISFEETQKKAWADCRFGVKDSEVSSEPKLIFKVQPGQAIFSQADWQEIVTTGRVAKGWTYQRFGMIEE